MKRDMDLCRQILLEIEAKGGNPMAMIQLSIPGQSPEFVSYQVALMEQAGLLVASDQSGMTGYNVMPQHLTWAGHDFLDAARDDTVWNKVRNDVGSHFKSVPFEILKALLVKALFAAFS